MDLTASKGGPYVEILRKSSHESHSEGDIHAITIVQRVASLNENTNLEVYGRVGQKSCDRSMFHSG